VKPKQSTLDKAFAVTPYYEGGYNAIAGHNDGQWLSLGLIQYNLGQGTLQPLFYRLFNEYPQIAEDTLPEGGKWLKNALDNGWIEQWALDIQEYNSDTEAHYKVIDPWYTALYNLCNTEEFRQIQRDASQKYVDAAIRLCSEFNIYTDRAFCLFFDIAVQKGEYYQGYALIETDYFEKLVAISNYAADTSNESAKLDVRIRKLSITNGRDMSADLGMDQYHLKGWCSVEFDDQSAFEEETQQSEPPSETPVTVSEEKPDKDWKQILSEKVSEPDAWIKVVEAAQEKSDLGEFEIVKYLPELIVKIGG